MMAVVMMPILLGSRCNQTNQRCGNNQGGTPIGCTAPNVPQCLNNCRPEHTETAANAGAACAIDPCAPNSVWTTSPSPVGVCPPEFFCNNARHPSYPTNLQVGRCVRTAQRGALGCDPEDRSCETGTYCRAFTGFSPGGGLTSCTGLARPQHISAASGFNGMCVLPVREGGSCDANPGELGCLQCEAGTTCQLDNTTGLRVCQRPCTTSADCSCAPGSTTQALGCGTDRLCDVCISNGGQCQLNGYGCCDSQATCAVVDPAAAPGLPAGTRACSRPTNSPCTSNTQCAAGDLCSSGQCRSCGGLLEAPDAIRGCCGDLEVRSGLCRVKCTQTGACTPAGCPAGQSTYTCTDRGSVCPAVNTNSDTSCNNVDNDCSPGGQRDEDFPTNTPCASGVPGTVLDICPGFTSPLGGRRRCVGGVEECRARPGLEVCYRTPTVVGGGGTNCSNLGAVCGSDSQCGGGERCLSDTFGNLRCNINPVCPTTLCWMPGTTGGGCP
jgi:hypothetical protein